MKNSILLWKKRFASLALFGMIAGVSFAQEGYQVQFQDGVVNIPENIQTFDWDQMPDYAQFEGGYFGWVQFYETPTQDIQDLFKAQGLQLINYLPQKTYLFYFPRAVEVSFLADQGVRAIVPAEGQYKLSETLKTGAVGDHAIQGDNFLVTLQHYDWIDTNMVIADLANKQISVLQQYKGSNNIDLLIPNNCLQELSNLPYVKWVEEIVAPSVKDDTRGRSLHRSNGLDTQTSSGQNYTGVGVGVMVRDDGEVGPHIDFQGRLDNSGASGTGQTHGDGVAGIMAGAGNLNPSYRGMAAGSDVYVVNYVANFLDSATQDFINNGDVQITNSSYSNGCNAGYTTVTETVDQQTNDIPSVLHVFSAGNSNNNNCGYGAGNQWGNITGGHKQGKNVIATANVFYDGGLVNSSSRGPAHDGRIKPDIAANGQNQISTDENNDYLSFGGTSGAAPGIAGISAQLYELYADLNGGVLPPSALIKAALLNTANDYGNVGPDFKFGWGIVNGNRAGELIQNGTYIDGQQVSQGNTNTHTITVPANASQLRIMVYWSDEAGAPGSSPSLVNDLDMVVTDPSNGTYLPWILDHTPDPTLLNLPATNGPDHLNNVEQVLINAPAAGSYDIDISGFNVPVGPQEYYVVYHVIEDHLTLTYPNNGEHFVPGEQETIHWDAVNTAADFTLEYSTNNGGSWNNITTVGSSVTNTNWTVPNTISGEVLVRITSGSYQDQSDEVFSIASLVTGIQVDEVCVDNATFSWNAVANANEYDFYILGEKYMEVVGTSNTNSITVPIDDPNMDIWYAAVAKNTTDGWESRRTVAELYDDGLLNCVLANNMTLVEINSTPGDFTTTCGSGDGIVTVTIANTGAQEQTDFEVSYQLNSNAPVVETYTETLASGEQVVYEFATPVFITDNGAYTLVVEVDLDGDEYEEDNSQEMAFNAQVDATDTPYQEGFDTNGFPPNDFWSILNPDDSFTWEDKGPIGTSGTATLAAWMDNYSYNEPGEEDYLVTEILDLNNISGALLQFDLAKAQFSNTLFDGLRVEISIDCGSTFTTIYDKTDLELSTIPNYDTTNDWEPSNPDEWRLEEIDLAAYEGNDVFFRFVNINGYGNSTFIDNINVVGILSNGDFAQLELGLQPNPADNMVHIAFGNERPQVQSLAVYNSLGQMVIQLDQTNLNTAQNIDVDVSSLSAGLYFVKLQTEGQQYTKKLLVR